MQILYQEDSTTSFVLECRARLQNILQRLEWSQEGVLKNFNTNSLAATPTETKKLKQTPAAKVHDYPPSCSKNNSFVLATPELQSLLQNDNIEAPKNFQDLQANFSREQKLQIYENVIQNTKKLDNNSIDEVREGEQSLAEIVAENKREANRKKRKFRIAKPTRIEEVRALVELQMQSLQQFIRKQKEVGSKRCKTMKEELAYGTDARKSFHRRDDSEGYIDRNMQPGEKYKSNRSSTNKRDRLRSNCESYTNSYRKQHRFDNARNDSTSKHARVAGNSSRCDHSSDREIQRTYERHKRTRTKSTESGKFHKDKVYKDRETYQKPEDNYNRHKRECSKSLQLGKLCKEKCEKLDYKVKNVEIREERDRHGRSTSRDKHRYYKRKYKRSRSRDHYKLDVNRKENPRHKHKR